MPTITAAPLSGQGSIHGIAGIDPGPSGGALISVEPPFDVLSHGGGAGEILVSQSSVVATGTVENFGAGIVTFDDAEISSLSGGQAEVDFPDLAIEAGGTVQQVGQGLVTIDGFTVEASGIQHIRGAGEVSFPVAQIAGSGKREIVGEAQIVVVGISITGAGGVGPIGNGSIDVLPGADFTIDAIGWIAAKARGDILFLPSFNIFSEGHRSDRFATLVLRYEDDES